MPQSSIEHQIQKATSIDELIAVIENYPGEFTSSTGIVLSKKVMVDGLRKVASDPGAQAFIVNNPTDVLIFQNMHLTSKHGLQAKARELINELYFKEPDERLRNADTGEFKAFLDRLEATRITHSKKPNKKLSKLVSNDAVDAIFNYMLMTRNANKNHYPQRQVATSHLSEIASLPPGGAYRLDKKTTGLARTLNIIRSKDGEFALIVETKSKLADNSKRTLSKKISGANKVGKSAWRIDAGATEYFNLVTKLSHEDALIMIKDEVRVSTKYAGPNINLNELGAEIDKNNEKKISVYSVKATGALDGKIGKIKNEHQDLLITDILNGVKKMHDSSDVHQDLKPHNILVYGRSSEGFRAKLTDFGSARKDGDEVSTLLATTGYESPEISLFYAQGKSENHQYHEYYKYFNNPSEGKSFGAEFATQLTNVSLPKFAAPNKANDAWALGLIIFEIRHGRMPTASKKADIDIINNDPLLKGLLNPVREQRLTVSEALEMHSVNVKNKMIGTELVQDLNRFNPSLLYKNVDVKKKFMGLGKHYKASGREADLEFLQGMVQTATANISAAKDSETLNKLIENFILDINQFQSKKAAAGKFGESRLARVIDDLKEILAKHPLVGPNPRQGSPAVSPKKLK